jgi:hypothetical protein
LDGCGFMKQDFREYVESKLTRDDDIELFRDLLEAYARGGPKEVKNGIENLIKEISEA